MNNKKVLVSGCYDLLHGGHIAFLKQLLPTENYMSALAGTIISFH